MTQELTPFKWEGVLLPSLLDEFLDRCLTVLTEAPKGIEIDVRDVVPLPSTIIGALSSLRLDAQAQGKSIRILASESGARSMCAVGLDKYIEILSPGKKADDS